MKSKKIKRSSKVVTEAYLDEKLTVFATRAILKIELELSLKEAFDKHEGQHKKDRDKILTKLDGIVGELQTMREENTVGAHQLRDHEKRITVLESAV